VAHALSSSRLLCVPLLACLVSCYAPQPMLVASSVSDWRAARDADPGVSSVAPPPAGWTADAMVERALARNPDLLGWSARVEAAAASVDAAGGFRELEFRVTRGELSDFEDGDPLFDLALRGRPPRPGDISSREDAARLRVEEISAQHDDARRRLRAQVRRLHAVLILCAREVELLRAEELLRVAHHELERARLSQGAASTLDVALAELEKAQVQDSLHALSARRLRAEGTLRALLDLPADQPITPVGDPGGIAEDAHTLAPVEREAWVAEGLQARAALRETTAALGRARADAYRADSELWPWLGWVELSYELSERSTPMSWGFALAIDLPIFAWTGAETQAASALTRQRVQEHQGTITRVAREIEGAFAAEEGARQRLATLRETLRSAVAGATEAASAARPVQVPETAQRLRLEVATLRAQRRELDALDDWVTARLNLFASVGR
jgi:outer membrane protein TolC